MFKYIRNVLATKSQRKWFWFVMILLLSFYPYEIANAYYPIDTTNIRVIFSISVFLTAIILFKSKRKIPRALIVCLVVMVIGSLLSFSISGHKYYYHKLIILYASFCLILIVYNLIGYRQFFTLYNRWILIMAILGCIGFVIAMIGVPPLMTFIAKEDGRTVYSWVITFTKSPSFPFIRYSGFFDEPGAMGYWGCFALGINRIFIKDKIIERLLLLTLVFTFSMGYLMQAFAYIFMFSIKGSRLKDKFLYILITLFLFIGIYATKSSSYSFIYERSIGRIEQMFDADADVMSFEGTTREVLVEKSKEVFLKNPVWGIGWSIDDSDEYIGDNVYETLAHDGIVGTFYQYFPYLLLLFWAFSRKDWETIFVIIFLALAVFHRPIHPNLLTYFIFYSLPLIYSIKVKEEDFASRFNSHV